LVAALLLSRTIVHTVSQALKTGESPRRLVHYEIGTTYRIVPRCHAYNCTRSSQRKLNLFSKSSGGLAHSGWIKIRRLPAAAQGAKIRTTIFLTGSMAINGLLPATSYQVPNGGTTSTGWIDGMHGNLTRFNPGTFQRQILPRPTKRRWYMGRLGHIDPKIVVVRTIYATYHTTTTAPEFGFTTRGEACVTLRQRRFSVGPNFNPEIPVGMILGILGRGAFRNSAPFRAFSVIVRQFSSNVIRCLVRKL
jgi:hypothetical protein